MQFVRPATEIVERIYDFDQPSQHWLESIRSAAALALDGYIGVQTYMLHFEMYLSDLVVLGFDVPIKLSNALRFLWADESKCSRQTCYALAAMLEAAPLNLRLVIVEAIESAGAAAFETLAALAEEYADATGTKLQFFGARHKALETGHALGTEDIERDLNAVVLAACEREQARQLVDRVFCVFSAMMQELHEYGVGVNSGSKAGLRRTTHG